MLAARPEIAALRPLVRQRQLAGDRDQRPRVLVGARQRNRAEQPLRVRVPHAVEDVLDLAGLDRLAGIHDRDAVAGLEDQAEIVRHEDHRRAELLAEPLDQLDDAGLDRHVERGRRLVEQKQRRLRQQRHGNDDALLLAAGKLVRIGAHHALRIGQAHRPHQFRARACRPPPSRPCRAGSALPSAACRPSWPGSGSPSAPGRSWRSRCRGWRAAPRRTARPCPCP